MVALKGTIVIALSLCYLWFDRATPSGIDDEAALFVAALGVLVTA